MQGSTSSIVNQDMSIAAAYFYEDFGQTTELTGNTIENEICYTGALYDKVTGLYYLNARYYDPEYARFISQDTYRGEMKDRSQWHLYVYCANNPINYVDPSGHLKKHWWNSVTWVARFIDAAVAIYAGVGLISSYKAASKYLSKNATKIGNRTKKCLREKVSRKITGTVVSTAIEAGLILYGTSIGELIANGLDYVDSYWGYKRCNGYIFN